MDDICGCEASSRNIRVLVDRHSVIVLASVFSNGVTCVALKDSLSNRAHSE